MFDGASMFAKVALLAIGGWLCAMPFLGFWPSTIALIAILIGLYHLLHLYNQLEQRDIDDAARAEPGGFDEHDAS